MGTQRPDIFITGVMKGGTTILHDYICTHPEISSGTQKEIHYFSLYYDKGEEWYNTHFANVETGQRTIDASPTYFDIANTAQIPRLMKKYCNDPRVILITRDPIERAISQFVHLKVTTKAPALQDVEIDELFSQDIAEAFRQNTTMGYYLNQILGFSLYTRKFITYRQELEKHQFLVLDNKSLRESPRATMEKVYDFVGVDYVDNEQFGVVKHSNGSGINQISLESYNKLADILYPDYKHFCHQAGIKFEQAQYDDGQLERSA